MERPIHARPTSQPQRPNDAADRCEGLRPRPRLPVRRRGLRGAACLPRQAVDGLRRRTHETIAAGGFGDCVVYMQVTRGAVYPRRHAFPADTSPTELLWVEDYDDTKTAQLRQVGVSVISQPDLRWQRCGIKSTNLLANVLANQAPAESGAAETIPYLPDRP